VTVIERAVVLASGAGGDWLSDAERTGRTPSGGKIETEWVDRAVTTVGRLGNVTDREVRMFADQLRGKPAAVLTVPVDADITEDHRVRLDDVEYVVTAIIAGHSFETARRLLVVAV
jgi:hypothetical protein